MNLVTASNADILDAHSSVFSAHLNKMQKNTDDSAVISACRYIYNDPFVVINLHKKEV
jgi:hypothetical protein